MAFLSQIFSKELLSAIAIALTFAGLLPYLLSIIQNKVKPHVFSWVIWALATLIVFSAQLSDGAGVGAWPIGISGGITMVIALLAYFKKGDNSISNVDWVFLVLAILSLPLWYFTSDPLWTVIILTTVDLLGFGPTYRKSYHFPFEEKLILFGIIALRNIIVIFALEHYSLTTVLFPAVSSIACMFFIIMVSYRRSIN